MRSLKRLITALLAFVMILTCVGIPAFAADFSDITDQKVAEAVDKLVGFNIITGYEDGTFRPDNQITRAEFAAIVTRYKGIADNLASDAVTGFSDLDADSSRAWARPYVKAAVDAKIINGFDDGTFRAGEPVTYEQAVKMLVCAAGYEVVAQSELNKIKITNPNATWSAGYIAAANKHGITKGVITAQITQPASRGVVAVLTSNTIDVPELKENEDGTFEKGETEDKDQNLIQVTGVVTGTFYTGLASDHVGLGIDEITIKTNESEEKYGLSESIRESFDLEDYVGKYVSAYYDKIERKITSISQRNNTTTVIKEANVIRPISGDTVKYYDSNGARKSVELSDYTCLYNGKYVPTGSVNLESAFKNGEIELVEAAGTKTAKITSYEVFVVNSYTKANERFTFKYGKTYDNNNGEGPQGYYQFPTTTDTKPVIYVNGVKKDFDSLSLPPYSVVNYMESPYASNGNKIRKMYVTTGSKSGKVTGSYEDSRKVELNNNMLYLTNDYANYSESDKAPFEIGDTYSSYYLDYTGQIAAVNYSATQSSSYQFGYIINADRNAVILLEKDGTIGEIPLKTNVKVDGNSVSAGDVRGLLEISAATVNAGYNSVFTSKPVSGYAQPVKYSKISGQIDGIDTVAVGTGGSGDTFACDAPLSGTSKPTSSRVTIDSTTYQVNNAVILYVPDNRESTGEYAFLSASKAFNSTDRYIEIYGSDSGSVIKNAGFVLVYGSDPTLVFKASSPYMVVTGISYEGDNVVINGYKNGSKSITPIKVNSEKFKVDTELSPRSVDYSTVAKGDLIRYLGADTAVSRIEMLYDADDDTKNLNTSNGVSFSDTSDSDFHVKYGVVVQNDDGATFYITTELGDGNKLAEDKLHTYRIVSSTAIYNNENGELVATNGYDVVSAKTPDRVIVITREYTNPSANIIYVVE